MIMDFTMFLVVKIQKQESWVVSGGETKAQIEAKMKKLQAENQLLLKGIEKATFSAINI